MPCGLPTRRYFQAIYLVFKCPAGCQPAGTFKPFIWCSNALRAANPQVLSSHLFGVQMPCGLPTRRYFQAIYFVFKCPAGCQPAGTFKSFIWCSNALRAANPHILSSHLFGVQMPCGLPARTYFQAIYLVFKCPAGCQPADTFKPFICCSNALRAANHQVLSSRLFGVQMPCGLPTRRYLQAIYLVFKCPAGCQRAGTFKPFICVQMPCGLPTRRYFQAIYLVFNALRAANPQVLSSHLFGVQMPCGLPTRRYFQAIYLVFKCPAGCQPAGTFKPFIWCSNALRAANPQILSSHLFGVKMSCGLPTRRYFQAIYLVWKCPAGCQPAGTFKPFIWCSNALRAANPQVLSSHLFGVQMPCGLPTRRYFQAIYLVFKCPAGCQPADTFKPFIWCSNALRAANHQVLSSHLFGVQMPCGLPTRRYFQAIYLVLKCPAGCQPAGTFKPFIWCSNALRLPITRYFQAIYLVFKCPAGCQSTGTFKPFIWCSNALRAANPQILSSHLFGVQMPCGPPTRRYFQAIYLVFKCPAGCQPADTFKPFIWCSNALWAANPQVLSSRLFGVKMPCGLPTRRYFQAIYLVFKCPAGCQPAGTFKPLIWCSNALRAANPQILSSHLFGVQMPCGLPTRRYFQAIYLVFKCPAGCQPADTFKPFIWCSNALRAANPQILSSHLFRVFKCPAGCQPAGTFKPFIWCSNALRAANPQVLSSHLFGVQMPCGLPTRRYFQAIYLVFKCPAGCQPAGTFKSFIWCSNALRAANPQVLSSRLFGVQMPCGLPTRRYFQAIYLVFKCPAGCQPAGTFKPFSRCSNALRAANQQVLSSHLFGVQMPCGLPTRRYFQAIYLVFKCPAGQPADTLARRAFEHQINGLKVPAGWQPAGHLNTK